jgi:acyl-homoserine lactone acylase PvdQ
MTLFTLWQEQLRSSAHDGQYSRFLAFEEVVRRLERAWGTSFVPWGEINRLQREQSSGHPAFSDERTSTPVRGGPGSLGIVFHFEAEELPGGRRRYGGRGQAAAGVVSLGPEVSSRSVTMFGQSADPASPHYFDQAPLYGRGELKLARFARAEVMTHGRRAYQPGAAQTVR